MKTLLLILAFAAALVAQTGRTVSLSWTASTTTGVTYNIYRGPGSCSPTPPNGTKINAAPISTLTYDDTTMPAVGVYCYYATAVANSLESPPSNRVEATILPKPPSGMTGTIAMIFKRNGMEIARVELADFPVPEVEKIAGMLMPAVVK